MPRTLSRVLWRAAPVFLAAACHHAVAPVPPPPAVAPPPPPALSRLFAIRVNNTQLAFRTAGSDGAPVVFVHDSYGDLDDWRAQVDAFSPAHRVLVYSRRYHPPNAAQDDGEVYSPALHAADLAALLEALRLAPAHVVGAGYGAYVALVLALERPDLVRTLVLGEPPVIPLLLRTPGGDTLRRALLEGALEPARVAFARGDSLGAARLFVNSMTAPAGGFDGLPAAERTRILAHSYALRREVMADPRQAFPALDCARLGRVAMPVLLLRGARSPRLYEVITTELTRCLQSDTIITLPSAGHALQATSPAPYNATVLRFIAAH